MLTDTLMSDTWCDRIKQLCEKIVREQDPEKLGDLAKELDQLVAEEQERRRRQGTPQIPTRN